VDETVDDADMEPGQTVRGEDQVTLEPGPAEAGGAASAAQSEPRDVGTGGPSDAGDPSLSGDLASGADPSGPGR